VGEKAGALFNMAALVLIYGVIVYLGLFAPIHAGDARCALAGDAS